MKNRILKVNDDLNHILQGKDKKISKCIDNDMQLESFKHRDKRIKIILSNKFKKHMEFHNKQFIIPYSNLIRYMQLKGIFDHVNEKFVEMVVELPFDVGYTEMCSIGPKHDVIYAKRKSRYIYSKFTLDGRKKMINKCVVVLKQSCEDPIEYYLITMFPGEYIVKEPQDKNIKTEAEKKNMMKFWDNHALVFNPKEVDLESITYKCPYGYMA